MKKTILTAAIISALLISCKDTKNGSNKAVDATEAVSEQATSDRDEMAAETHSINNEWVEDIKLDDGSKWHANSETTKGVDKMMSLIESSNTKTVKDYQALASKLNEVKNFVVKECTMKGPSHDNLHVFLHPLIEKIDSLGKVSTVEEGSEVKAGIKENLKEYYNYFK